MDESHSVDFNVGFVLLMIKITQSFTTGRSYGFSLLNPNDDRLINLQQYFKKCVSLMVQKGLFYLLNYYGLLEYTLANVCVTKSNNILLKQYIKDIHELIFERKNDVSSNIIDGMVTCISEKCLIGVICYEAINAKRFDIVLSCLGIYFNKNDRERLIKYGNYFARQEKMSCHAHRGPKTNHLWKLDVKNSRMKGLTAQISSKLKKFKEKNLNLFSLNSQLNNKYDKLLQTEQKFINGECVVFSEGISAAYEIYIMTPVVDFIKECWEYSELEEKYRPGELGYIEAKKSFYGIKSDQMNNII